MKFNISDKHFLELINKGFDLNVYFLLRILHEGNEIDSLCKENVKISAMKQSLLRKGLITEEDKLTSIGQELILFMESRIAGKISRKKPESGEFNEFWEVYPNRTTFEYKGRVFTGDRALKADKTTCQIKFEKIVSEGEYTAREIIEALKMELIEKKEASFKSGDNKLKYMKNSLTYLNQKAFDPYVEDIRKGKVINTVTNFDGVNL